MKAGAATESNEKISSVFYGKTDAPSVIFCPCKSLRAELFNLAEKFRAGSIKFFFFLQNCMKKHLTFISIYNMIIKHCGCGTLIAGL